VGRAAGLALCNLMCNLIHDLPLSKRMVWTSPKKSARGLAAEAAGCFYMGGFTPSIPTATAFAVTISPWLAPLTKTAAPGFSSAFSPNW
jgi:hypothetical protein